jgi:carboxyl-terminal processing protease
MRILLSVLLLFSVATAQDFAARFDTAWRLVAERYWDINQIEPSWDELRDIYKPLALAAENERAFFAVIEELYEQIGDDHSVFVPPSRVQEIRMLYGDLPCLGVFATDLSGRLGSVRYEVLEPGIGYVSLPDLASSNVAGNLRQAVRTLVQGDVSAIILDMRGNPGGRLIEMMQAAGVFTSGFLWRTVTSWSLPLPYPAIGLPETDLPLVILIDRGVNSAAEGLAGALQKRERAVIIGETSAGNVEAVLPFCLRDGSQAWIATGVLAPIGGPTWEGVGVIPDIAVNAENALEAAIGYIQEVHSDD